MLKDVMPAFANLCAYFHQDCFLDHVDADAVLRYYVENESVYSVKQVLRELEQFLASIGDDSSLDTAIYSEFFLAYDPTADGWPTSRAWLEHVCKRLREFMKDK